MADRGNSSYRFESFVVSRPTRALLRGGREVPLIPRYFDLLLLLLERRHEAVPKQEIFDAVWGDVIVSDGSLSQAVRTLRRALGDDSRNPRFIRTVSRYGYRFVHDGVVEEVAGERDRGGAASAAAAAAGSGATSAAAPRDVRIDAGDAETSAPGLRVGDSAAALERLLAGDSARALEDDDRREAAAVLHGLGTDAALSLIAGREGEAAARALLRDTRWDVAGAGRVPLWGAPHGLAAARLLAAHRLSSARRAVARRGSAAAAGGALAGALAGTLGALLLVAGPSSHASMRLPPTLALIGGIVGGLGAAGVGAGLALAEAASRSQRGAALVIGGALGGGAVGAAFHHVALWSIEGLFGHAPQGLGGGVEGFVIGCAAGVGYALATPRPRGGGMATPRGSARGRGVASA
ncbi:MAG TPA: winged helix-turn-helix domain-containing protein [Myxococcota bacterium]|nr:winged helix-turn-helix domain-containing protein [Myxococcota bacterium]